MNLSDENKNFLVYLSKYLGVALIAGSVVHIGTLQNGFVRYVILMCVGLVLMIVGNIFEAKQNGQKVNLNYLLLITGLSLATGFLSGGIQHFLDNPPYAGILLGIGLIGAYITYFIRDKVRLEKRNLVIVAIFSLFIILFSSYVIDDLLLGENHHAENR
jgi:hypothetical protein